EGRDRGLYALEHAGPAIAIVRPREPSRLVRFPFGRHPIAESARPCCGICVQFERHPRGRRAGRQNGARIILAVSQRHTCRLPNPNTPSLPSTHVTTPPP